MSYRMVVITLLLSTMVTLPGCSAATNSENGASSSQILMTEQASVRKSLEQLVDAYENKQGSRFMALVAEDYVGDSSILESGLRSAFSANHNVRIRFSVTHTTISENGKAAIGVNFTSNFETRSTGKVAKSNGTTELVFKKEGGVYKLYSMQRPFLFGTTD